jgi:hypothetical protein|tara:strand:+ start:4402 stop:4722 length:321 start_codon:yes stop_codon:yes gene_type:complete
MKNLGTLISQPIFEAEKLCKENGLEDIFEMTKKVFMVIFYPIGLESINEVSEVANREECSEYEVFRHFTDSNNTSPKKVDIFFKEYLLEGKIPHWITQSCRNYLRS